MWHGNKRFDSPWSPYGKNGQNELITILSGDVIERTFILSIGGKFNISEVRSMYIKAGVDYVNIVNMKSDISSLTANTYYGENIEIYLNEECSSHSDVQMSFCVGYIFII